MELNRCFTNQKIAGIRQQKTYVRHMSEINQRF